VHRELLAIQALQDHKESLDHKDHKGYRDSLAKLDPQAHKEKLVLLDHREKLAQQDHKVLLD
jgi:hypothetical protein